MFTRPLGGLALAALLLAPQLASAKNWKELENQYLDARDDVLAVADGKKLPVAKDEKPDDRLKRSLLALEKLPKELFEEHPKRATELLLKDLLSDVRPLALAAQKGLTKATGRDSKPVVKAFDREKSPRAKRLLAYVLSQIDERGAMVSLVKATKSKDARTRAAVATAIGTAGARAKGPSLSALRKLLRDKSALVQHAAASALRVLGQKVDKFPAPTYDAVTGIPEHFAADKVVFLLDATGEAAEEAFEDPFAKQDEAGEEAEEGKQAQKKGKKGKKKKGKGEPDASAPLSPFQIMGQVVTEAAATMQETKYKIVRFGTSTHEKGGYQQGGAKQRSELESWFKRSLSRERDRSVGKAIRDVISSEPDVIYLFLCGLPTTRGGRDDGDAALEEIGSLLWGEGIQLHVIRFVVPPATDPRTEGAKQARQEFLSRYTKISGKLASLTGGQSRTIELSRQVAEEAAPDATEKEKLDVDLTQAISSRDAKAVEKAFRAAQKDPDTEGELLVEALGACPDPRNALPLALEALLGEEHSLSAAAARGLAKNSDPRVLFAIAKRFRSEKDPANQIRLLHAMGRAPGQSVTDGLVAAAASLPADPARVAWRYISERPAAELTAAKPKLVRRSRDLVGMSRAYANLALAKAANQPPPGRTGLSAGTGKFLPDRFLEYGVAFVIDSNRATKEILWTPPAAEEPKDAAPEKGKRKRPKRRKKGEPDAAEAPQPLSVQDAIRQEVTRALGAIGRASGAANLYLTGGKSFKASVTEMSGALEEAKIFLTKAQVGPQRDVLKPIERALGDRKVERIVVLVSGLPIRSEGQGDPAVFLKKVRTLNAGRAVQIDVVYVLPPVSQTDAAAVARRKDELANMDRLYQQLAGQNDGKVLVRTRLAGAGGDSAEGAEPEAGK